jgi:hypothetical protein
LMLADMVADGCDRSRSKSGIWPSRVRGVSDEVKRGLW